MIIDRNYDPWWCRNKKDIDGATLIRLAARAAERRAKAGMLAEQEPERKSKPKWGDRVALGVIVAALTLIAIHMVVAWARG